MSFNKINNIKPLSEINSKKLKYLFIQNNQIEDVQVFIEFNSKFKSLEIIRLDNNKINENSDSFKKLLSCNKNNNQIIITNSKMDEIKNLYNIDYNENMEELNVDGTEKGDSLLKNIFIIISNLNNNRIKKLKLKGNKIGDPSIINKIQFNFLEELDLSRNNIKNLDFLKEMKAKKLTDLFLNHNSITDLSLLYNIEEIFPCMKRISLYNNNFNPEEPKIKDLANYLNSKNIKLFINYIY